MENNGFDKSLISKNNSSNLISVIVTVNGYSHLLHNCLESIIYQTYENLEIIVVVNYSRDSSFYICQKFAKKDSRIKVFEVLCEAESDLKNYGLSKTTGDYIAFVTGSDFISLNYLEYQLYLLNAYNADIAQCELIKVPEIESAENTFVPPKQNVERIYELLPWQAIENLHSISNKTCLNTVVLWNKLFKKEIFDGITFPTEKNFEDEFTTYKLFRKSKKIVATNQILYAYIQIGTFNHNKIYDEHNLDILEAYENYMKFFKKMNSPYMLERVGRRYLRLLLRIRKEISTFDVILHNKTSIIQDLDSRFMSIYKYLDILSNKYPYLADTKTDHKIYYNKYNTYIKIVNSFNKEYLQYNHNQMIQNLT